MKKALTPIEVITNHLENYYIKDKELQGRYDNELKNINEYQSLVNDQKIKLAEYTEKIEKIRDLVVNNAIAGVIIKEINEDLINTIDAYYTLVRTHEATMNKLKISKEHNSVLENLTIHKLMVIYGMLKQFGLKENYPDWSKKYEKHII